MGFVTFMRSSAGRVLRVVAGALLVWFGLTQTVGVTGVLVATFGLVAIAAGIFNFCLAGPVFGVTLMGRKPFSK